jgi:Ca2+-binding EF-hand superfamily protein
MFHSGNLYRFFDIDGNGIIDEVELKTAIDYINEIDDVKLKSELKKIYDDYMSVDGNTYESWISKGK